MTTPPTLTFADIARETGQRENTVRSHFTVYRDVFCALDTTGARGQRLYNENALKTYEIFMFLRSKDVRLSVDEALKLLRAHKRDMIFEAKSQGINRVFQLIQEFRSNGTL